MTNIYLIGMPGCGKSTIGAIVSKNTGFDFVDADEFIVNSEGRTIEQMFEIGEEEFRIAETKALKELSKKNNLMVATGGGIVTREENIDIMKSTGKVIFIDASVSFILENCALDGRPLLKDKNKIHDLYNKRISIYRKAADITILNDGILSDVCKRMEEAIRKTKKDGLQ
jgi:shikimate kinase